MTSNFGLKLIQILLSSETEPMKKILHLFYRPIYRLYISTQYSRTLERNLETKQCHSDIKVPFSVLKMQALILYAL